MNVVGSIGKDPNIVGAGHKGQERRQVKSVFERALQSTAAYPAPKETAQGAARRIAADVPHHVIEPLAQALAKRGKFVIVKGSPPAQAKVEAKPESKYVPPAARPPLNVRMRKR